MVLVSRIMHLTKTYIYVRLPFPYIPVMISDILINFEAGDWHIMQLNCPY